MDFYTYITSDLHRAERVPFARDLASEFSAEGLSPEERMTRRFELLCAAQRPSIHEGEQIVLMRTAAGTPDVFTPDEWAEIKRTHYVHELGYISNITPDYSRIISRGLLAVREDANEFARREIDALLDLCDRYRDEAIRLGRSDVAEILGRVPRYPAESFREALQFFRIIHFGMWLEGNYHVTIGRFDKLMLPYYNRDKDKFSDDEMLDLLSDFFLSFNKDSDLYVGVQQGDNGQAMMLGGIDGEGNDIWSRLSELCLLASGRNRLIDPKINVRVSHSTPMERFVLGTHLTAVGMGFPQYSNDDIVIPALEDLGYAPEDAKNYNVAACWEFIVPGRGMDIVNIAALSFPKMVDRAIHDVLCECEDFDELRAAVAREIRKECESFNAERRNVWFAPSPFMSLAFDCPNGDISRGSVYNNFGAHGTGLATAADSLAAIKKYVFDEQNVTPAELLAAVDSNFEECSYLLPLLRYESPKMGVDPADLGSDETENSADGEAAFLLGAFADGMKGLRNDRGGIWRAGTGSAMYYLWHANELGASPDGRRKGEAFGTNYSPSLFARTSGPVSVIRSFTKPNLRRVCNGGPLTLEFDGAIFADESSIEKVAALVKLYIDLGGHQLQLNAVSRDTLLDAQAHPEKYRHLIVRIWGWSAYFVELDKEYQDHVIARREFAV